MLLGNYYSNNQCPPLTQEEKKKIVILPLVGGWVVGGMVDGAVDQIIKHVFGKLL